jgi:hypothetical protein
VSKIEAIEFFQALKPGGPWVLTAIVPDGATETITARSPAEITAFIDANNGKRNIYYTLNPLRSATSKKPSKTDVAAIEYLLADLDPRDDEKPEAAKERYTKQLNGGGFFVEPAALVDSGNGLQGVWRLSEPIPLGEPTKNANGKLEFSPEDKAKIEDAEARSKSIMSRLGSNAGTQNIDRLLRVPRTINLPNAKKRKLGRVECNASVISLSDVSHPLDAFPREEPKAKAETKGKKTKNDGERRLPRELLNMLYLSGDKPADYPSRSELFFAFVNEALRRGRDESEIIDAAIDPAFEGCSIHDHVAENGGRDYVKRQIERAINATFGVVPDESNKQPVYVRDGQLHDAWRLTQVGLVRNKCPVFVRHNRPVEPLWRWERDDEGRDTLAAQLVPYNFWRLSDMVARHAAIFYKVDGRTRGWRRINPPKEVIETLLSRGDWEFPSVIGIVTSPTLRPDLSVLDASG